jgi:hypothetical protein
MWGKKNPTAANICQPDPCEPAPCDPDGYFRDLLETGRLEQHLDQ